MENALSVVKMSYFYAKSSFKLVKGSRASCNSVNLVENKKMRSEELYNDLHTKKGMENRERSETQRDICLNLNVFTFD